MRIAFLDSWLRASAEGSGTAVAIGGLAQALTDLGHRVDHIVPHPSAPRNLLLRRLGFNFLLPGRFRAADHDLCVGFDIDGFRLAHRCPVPYVCAIKGVLAEEARCERGWAKWMLTSLAGLERLNARRADLVISTSQYCCERIHHHYGVPYSHLRLVPEGIDLERWSGWSDRPVDPAAISALDRNREPFTVLCVARQYPRKRVIDLISAFRLVVDRLPQARLVVIGDGPEHGALRVRVRELNLEPMVRLLGALPSDQAVREWYRRSTLFCLPSEQEGFGIVFLEAMASGLPVVSTTAAAISEVVPQGQAGLLVPPRDPRALAAALLDLLTNPELLTSARAFGRVHARQYSWRRVAERFLEVVAEIRQGNG